MKTTPRIGTTVTMPVIAAGTGTVTHINVFTVAPEKQQLLVDSLIETVKMARTMPGWLSL